jgi:hypothetical protein
VDLALVLALGGRDEARPFEGEGNWWEDEGSRLYKGGRSVPHASQMRKDRGLRRVQISQVHVVGSASATVYGL